jgi:hypothetical protein
MKRLLLILVAALTALTLGCSSLPERSQSLEAHRGYEAYVQTVIVTSKSVSEEGYSEEQYEEYRIYIGNEESEKIDEEVASYGIAAKLTLLHPVEGAETPFPTMMGWYAYLFDNTRGINMAGDLFTEEVWSTMPFILKHILCALDMNDEDLVLISTELYSGSISIYYHTKYSEDKRFYRKKLAKLIEYFEANDLTEDIELSAMLATEI